MRKKEIFEEIVDIMKHDSASCKDKKGADPAGYGASITEDMTDREFVFLVSSYLASFGLTGHLNFKKKKFGRLPFRVLRYRDELYVVEALEESPLKVGDRVVKVDGDSVKDYGELHKEFLHDESEERQGRHWNSLLCFAEQLTYVSAVTQTTINYRIDLKEYEDFQPKYECRVLADGIMFIRLADFVNESEIQQMYADNAELLKTSKYLIIDVRNNDGGSDTAFLPLLQYCLPNGKTLDETATNDDGACSDGMEINYSKRNCAMRMKVLKEYLQMDVPEDTRKILTAMRQELMEKNGKGFCHEADEGMDIPIVGDSSVEKVYIITDSGCASSGDNFVYVFGMLPKVTVVGRPTMGILDYSNVACVEFEDYELSYPTSRLLALDKGKGMMKKGVAVDQYIPWTPKHLKKDVDLEYILEQLEEA